MKTGPAAAIYALVGLLVAAITVLAGTGHTVPTILEDALIALIAGGLGITVPSAPTTSTSSPALPAASSSTLAGR
jgi:hypothetical protein